MFETGTSKNVRAYHVMPGMAGPEGELHSHEYRIEVVVGRQCLDEGGMVVDLDLLNASLKAVTDQLEGADLECIRPADAEAVTVERFARWVYEALIGPVADAGADELAVRVWESPTAFGGYRSAVSTSTSPGGRKRPRKRRGGVWRRPPN